MKRWNRSLETVALRRVPLLERGRSDLHPRRITPAKCRPVGPCRRGLVPFVEFCLSQGDPILILLAFANTHLHAARQWTPAVARRWALIVSSSRPRHRDASARSPAFPSATTTTPTASARCSACVPLTIPLAWHVVVTNALFLVRAVIAPSSRAVEAIAHRAHLHRLRFHSRALRHQCLQAYWNWNGGRVPAKNYVAWFVLSARWRGSSRPPSCPVSRAIPAPPSSLG